MNVSVLDRHVVPDARVSASGAAVSLRGVTRSFGVHYVLRGIELDIPAGQFVAIVGRSGCGKSTLLRLIAGLDKPSDGMVGVSHSMNANARRREAEDVLAQVGLGGRGRDWPSVLSGGQKQRVALARALASHPRLLALDEPLGALDALTRIEMQDLIERAWRDKGFTAIVVTHDVTEAVALADRILLMEDGGITMDVLVDLPRPRRRGDARAAAIEGRILDRLLRTA